jgi:hypothetical protein
VSRDSGNTARIFLNGSVIASGTVTKNYSQGAAYINYNLAATTVYHTGYYSNLRIVKGTAVYTANFTPPTTPLTAIAGTSLLTCGTTWSGNPTITANGDARGAGLNPFGTGTGNHAYQTTSAARPTLRARYNQLLNSENFRFFL